MSDPNVIANPFADDLYGSLAPMAFGDADNDYALKTYIYALAQMFNEVESFARTDEDGNPPYSLLFDLNRAQGALIPYLAQFAGQSIPKGIDDASARALVRKPSNAERGTLAAIAKAVQSRLTGTKYLRIIERDTSPYHFSLYTRSAEQPISDQTFTNLITNPSFEVDTSGWSTATNGSSLTSGATLSRIVQSTGAPFGSALAQIDTTTAADRQGANIAAMPVTNGLKYQFSVYLKGNVGGENVSLFVGSIALNKTLTTSWQRFAFTYTATSTTTVGVGVRSNGGGFGVASRFFMDGAQFLQAYVDPGYFDGSMPGASWTGTAHASTSVLAATTPNGMVNAINAVKPAGLMFTYNVTPGTTIDELVGTIDSQTATIDNL